jgi:hypothetical protein
MTRRDRSLARTRLVLGVVLAAIAVVLAVLGRRREVRATERAVERLLRAADEAQGRTVTSLRETRDDLPAPVERYFETVLPADGWGTRAVRVEQAGDLRLGGPGSSWTAFTATHHATVGRPGFVWDATVDLLPGVSVWVRDALVDGAGSARVTLFGAVPVAGAGPSTELNEAELQRYLAEAVWYPTALLPENGVRWEPIDDRTARATLVEGETTASLTFHFSGTDDGNGDDGAEVEVERVHAGRRYRTVDGDLVPTPWTGLWREYEVRGGLRVPTEGEVVWHLPDGDFHAWRGRVTGFDREAPDGGECRW